MDLVDFLKWAHVLSACILIGTGTGIAFFMVMAHRANDPKIIAHTSSVVVTADFLFTASAVVVQPVTGFLLANEIGWSMTDGWIMLSILLYLFIGIFWLPVVCIQIKMRDEANFATLKGIQLSARYHRLYKLWFACGIPAFSAILVIIWLMLTKPQISFL